MKTNKCFYIILSLFVGLSVLLSACGPAQTAVPAEVKKSSQIHYLRLLQRQRRLTNQKLSRRKPNNQRQPSRLRSPGMIGQLPSQLIRVSWYFGTGLLNRKKNWMTKYIAEWEKLYPGVTIRYEVMPEGDVGSKLSTALVAGTGPDFSVLKEEWRVEYERNDLLAPLPKDLFPHSGAICC